MKFRKKIEKLFEGTFFISSTITSITVFVIVIFLFKEGIVILNDKPTIKNSILAINSNNPISHLSSLQVKDIFDKKYTNWKELGGRDDTIILLSTSYIDRYFTEDELGENFEHLPDKINELIEANRGIVILMPEQFISSKAKIKKIKIDKISLKDLFLGKEWLPTAEPSAQFGLLPLILGSLIVSIGAILLALPIGLITAVYMSEITTPRFRSFLKPSIELLAGIPSVVYGFFGLVVLVPLIQKSFNLPVGETALAGCIILAIMALPTIITVAEDAIGTTPNSLKEASLALGASKWQTIVRVSIPYAKSGITAASILGIGRAVGETMAVLMVTGNAAVIPHSLLQPVRTIPATIAAELGEAPMGSTHYKALFALGIILFLITMFFNFIVAISKNKRK